MECGVEMQGGDLHARVVNETEPIGFNNMMDHHHHFHHHDATEESLGVAERDMWLNNTTEQDDLLGMNDASMFYADFPPLLTDFPCMSSSSSSSSTPTSLPLKTTLPACSTTTTTTTTTTSSSPSASASSSSAASWAVLKEDGVKIKRQGGYMQKENDNGPGFASATLSSTASMEISQQQPDPGFAGGGGDHCMGDVMDTFGYMDLLESNDFFDPASIFQDEENPLVEFEQTPNQEEEYQCQQNLHAMMESKPQQGTEEDQGVLLCEGENKEEDIQGELEGAAATADDEMSMVFLEWLKSNKDSVSANDLRSVKLKKSTIESAARRLGGGKEGMKQLLKLILEWVQTSHLQNKRRKDNTNNSNNNNIIEPSNLIPLQQFQDPRENQNTSSFGPESNTCFNQTPWLSPPDQAPLVVTPQPYSQQTMVGYVGDPYTNAVATSNNMNHNPYQPAAAADYHMLESTHSWNPSQFPVASHFNQSFGDNNLLQPVPGFGGYVNQYPYQFFHGPGDRLMRLGPSATKEARKKRMARQRRFVPHRHHHSNNHHQNQGSDHPHARFGGDNCTNIIAASHANPASWMYWQTMTGGAAPLAPMVSVEQPQPQVDRPAMQTQNSHHQGRVTSDRRQGWKPEKNLRFLLQKVLKQSDVGSLGRIVLPKKEAESHLPQLEARDGISITMEDIGTSRVWNMRYRYWPNNKSRMYLLENTGDFVKANGLQEGDFIVIYSDVKCGKYMIRGVKVRQQGAKPEAKKGGKSQKNQHGNNATSTAGAAVANNVTASSPKSKTEKIL